MNKAASLLRNNFSKLNGSEKGVNICLNLMNDFCLFIIVKVDNSNVLKYILTNLLIYYFQI